MQTHRSNGYWPYIVGIVLAAVAASLFFFKTPAVERAAPSVKGPVAAALNPGDAARTDERPPSTAAMPPSPHAPGYEHADNLLAIVQAANGKTDRTSLELRARALH
ncbi:MAG: hypothetical protein ABIS07_04155, partial [Dokdonella sp.]